MSNVCRLSDFRPTPKEPPEPYLPPSPWADFSYATAALLDFVTPKQLAKTLREISAELIRAQSRDFPE